VSFLCAAASASISRTSPATRSAPSLVHLVWLIALPYIEADKRDEFRSLVPAFSTGLPDYTAALFVEGALRLRESSAAFSNDGHGSRHELGRVRHACGDHLERS
jgi:hypothetical protein